MMKVSKRNLTPILIGFLPDEQLLHKMKQLNKELDLSKIDFDHRLPHVTLWMGFVRTKQIASLNLGLQKIFQNVTIETKPGELMKFKGQFGRVWSLKIKKNRDLYLLQNRIHHFFEPFREKISEYEDFNRTTVDYINNFQDKSLDNYDPHITIGFGDNLNQTQINQVLTLKDPKMFMMGNYCTCVKQIQ